MKIVYVTETLAVIGGVERIVTEKARYMAEHLGYEVTIIACTQHAYQENAFPLSPNVRQINLEVPFYTQYYYGYPKRLWVKHKIKELFKHKLTEAINTLDPDVIIGILKFEADTVCSLPCRAMKIIECHEARFFALQDMGHKHTMLAYLYKKYILRPRYFRTVEKHADMVVTLTEGDKALWRKARKTIAIPNFTTIASNSYNAESKHVIAVGRISAEKGYDRLISIWKLVAHDHPDWQLDIFGNGELFDELNNSIQKSGDSQIVLHHSTKSIAQEYQHSSIYVLTSYYEGFALTLLEAMTNGLPSVAFDCPFGPQSMITDGENGYLVENGNTQLFVQRLGELMDSERKRQQMSDKAKKRSRDFAVDTVMKQWKLLLESL